MTGAVVRIEDTGIVLGTQHGSLVIPWEQMDEGTLAQFSEYAPAPAAPIGEQDLTPPDWPEDSQSAEAPGPGSGADPDADQPRILGLTRPNFLTWGGLCAALAAGAAVWSSTLARRKRRKRMHWVILSIAVPAAFWLLLWLIRPEWLPLARPLAPAAPLVIPLVLLMLPKKGLSPEERAKRIAAAAPVPLRTIPLHREQKGTPLTELDVKTRVKERTTFDRRFFERFLIPWFREATDNQGPRPRLTVRVRGRGIRARRIVQADEVGVLIAHEDSGDPLASAERYPYADIEEITIARAEGSPLESSNDTGA